MLLHFLHDERVADEQADDSRCVLNSISLALLRPFSTAHFSLLVFVGQVQQSLSHDTLGTKLRYWPQYPPPRTRFPRSVYFSTFAYVVHARIDRDGWKPSLRQLRPIPTARGTEIRSPTVHPDDRQRLRWRTCGCKEDTAADNIVCGANVDQLLREFAWLLVLRMEIHPQAKKECCKSNEDRTNGPERKLLFHRLEIRIVDGGSSAGSESDFRCWDEIYAWGS